MWLIPVGSVCLAGGWGQMAGIGPFSHIFGLGVDQWLEAKVVTPDGELRVANEVSNADLFWAIRGGGGGTFGVVVEATMKVYPEQPISTLYWWTSSAKGGLVNNAVAGDSAMDSATKELFSQLEPLLQKGVSGMVYGSAIGLSGVANFFGNNTGTAKMNQIMGPILNKMQSIPGMNRFQSKPYNYKTYKEYYTATFGPGQPPPDKPSSKGIVPLGGHLIDHKALTNPKIMDAFSMRHSMIGQWSITVGSPGRRLGNGANTSANPGWRDAVGQVGIINSDGVREFAKSIGAYGNEVRKPLETIGPQLPVSDFLTGSLRRAELEASVLG
jgi:hypothetical protein